MADLEAGLGTVLRLEAGLVDAVLVVTEPTAKSIDVARRAAQIASGRAEVIVVANKVRDAADLAAITAVLGHHQIVVVPEDAAVAQADRDGVAPIDADDESPAVRALVGLAERLTASRRS